MKTVNQHRHSLIAVMSLMSQSKVYLKHIILAELRSSLLVVNKQACIITVIGEWERLDVTFVLQFNILFGPNTKGKPISLGKFPSIYAIDQTKATMEIGMLLGCLDADLSP